MPKIGRGWSKSASTAAGFGIVAETQGRRPRGGGGSGSRADPPTLADPAISGTFLTQNGQKKRFFGGQKMEQKWPKNDPKMAKNGSKMAKKVTGVPKKIPKNPPKNRKNGQKRPHRVPRNCTKKSKNALKMSKRVKRGSKMIQKMGLN